MWKTIFRLGFVACSITAMVLYIGGWFSAVVVALASLRLLKCDLKAMLRNRSHRETVEDEVMALIQDAVTLRALPWCLGLILALEAAFAGLITFLATGGLFPIPDIGGVLGCVWAATFFVVWKRDIEDCVSVFNEVCAVIEGE